MVVLCWPAPKTAYGISAKKYSPANAVRPIDGWEKLAGHEFNERII